MQSNDFTKRYKKYQADFEAYLATTVQAHSPLAEAMKYSLMASGKRIRPVLLLLTLASFGENTEKGLAPAAAIEFIHTYSLIHDDLPAMDDDDLRRGQLASHKKFGEATAILAGDALLTQAFAELLRANLPANLKVTLGEQLAQAAGYQGMCAGQQLDIMNEGEILPQSELEKVHQLKTGKLFEFSVLAAGIIANASEPVLSLLQKFAQTLGLAFQVRDDLLDVLSTTEALGKKVGADAELEKNTYPRLLGTQETLHYFRQKMADAIQMLDKLQEVDERFDPSFLKALVKSLDLDCEDND